MAMMIMLLAAEDEGLGALFFGVFKGERKLRQVLGVPPGPKLLGAIALGHPLTADRSASAGRSAGRPNRTPDQIIHRARW
jgi:nitroreductase